VTSQLLIECGVAEIRACLIEQYEPVRFWFGQARGDEHLDVSPRAGRNYVGRVMSTNTPLNAAFVDIGDGRDAYLPLSKKYADEIHDGALIDVRVKSPPHQAKGALLRYVGMHDEKFDEPGACGPAVDAALEAVKLIGAGVEEILVDDGAAAAMLKSSDIDAQVGHETHSVPLFESFGVEAALDIAFEPIVPIEGGGRLVIDVSQALTAIDVDTGGLTASSSQRLREKVAIAAVHEAARQIRLRNIGGHVVIDFPSISGASARIRFNEQLKKAMKTIKGAGAFSFSKSGLFSFTVPHVMQSLWERFTEPTHTIPSPGRCFTTEWQAKSAIRKLEHRLGAARQSRFGLRLGVSLDSYIRGHDSWIERLRERYSARFEVICDDTMEERGFEIAEQ